MSSAFLNLTSLPYLDVTPRSESTFEHVSPASLADDLPLSSLNSGVSEDVVLARIEAACFAEREQTERRLEQQHAQTIATLEQGIAQKITDALIAFSAERSSYFARVESEVVHLSLAIARKILDREAKTDPLLLAGLVRVALDGIEDSSAVRLRVAPDRLSAWQTHLATSPANQRPELLPDSALSADDCVLETEAGVARLNYEVQLKEIERGFLDLLSQRPGQRPDQRPDRPLTPAPTA